MTLLLLFLRFGGYLHSLQWPCRIFRGWVPTRKLISPNLSHRTDTSQGKFPVRTPQRSSVSKDLTLPSQGEDGDPVGDERLPNSLLLSCFCSQLCRCLSHLCPQVNRRYLPEISNYFYSIIGNHKSMLSIIATKGITFSRHGSQFSPCSILSLSFLCNLTWSPFPGSLPLYSASLLLKASHWDGYRTIWPLYSWDLRTATPGAIRLWTTDQVRSTCLLTYKHTGLIIYIIFSFLLFKSTPRASLGSAFGTPFYPLMSSFLTDSPCSRLGSGPSQGCGLNCVHQKDMFKSWPFIPVNGPLCGKSLCRCNKVEMRSQWIRVGPHPKTGSFIRTEKFGHRDTQREDWVTNKTEIGSCVSKPRNANDCWQPPEFRRETWSGYLSEPPEQ